MRSFDHLGLLLSKPADSRGSACYVCDLNTSSDLNYFLSDLSPALWSYC